MSDTEMLIKAVILLVMILFLAQGVALERGMARREPEEWNMAALSQPTVWLTFGLTCLFIHCGLMWIIATIPLAKGSDERMPLLNVILMSAAGAAVVGMMLLDYFRSRHMLFERGMRSQGIFFSAGEFRWDQVKTLRYNSGAAWFTLTIDDGRVARISYLLRGMPTFAREALAKAPPEALDDAARGILERIVKGTSTFVSP